MLASTVNGAAEYSVACVPSRVFAGIKRNATDKEQVVLQERSTATSFIMNKNKSNTNMGLAPRGRVRDPAIVRKQRKSTALGREAARHRMM